MGNTINNCDDKMEIRIKVNDKYKDEYEYITSDVNSLIDKLKDNTKFKFNLPMLRDKVNGVGEGAIWITNINGEVQKGDLIVSTAIPGYGGVQDDDIVRSKTIAKVISNKVIKTYSDNSFLVPCVVMAC